MANQKQLKPTQYSEDRTRSINETKKQTDLYNYMKR